MGSSDFSPHPYTYHDNEDTTLSNFSLSEEDYKYKVSLKQIEIIPLKSSKLTEELYFSYHSCTRQKN